MEQEYIRDSCRIVISPLANPIDFVLYLVHSCTCYNRDSRNDFVGKNREKKTV